MKGTVMRPSFYDAFSCVGGECRNNCCTVDWGILVTKEEFRKLRNMVKSEELQEVFRSCFIPTDKKETVKFNQCANYYITNQGGTGECPFLNEARLCKLYTECRPENMPRTCRVFPRFGNTFLGVQMATLSTGCEEVVRLLLAEKDGIRMTDSPREIVADLPFASGKQFIVNNRPIADYYGDLLVLIMGILQNRDYTFPERMLCLGIACQYIDKLEKRDELEKIPATVDDFLLQMEEEGSLHLHEQIKNMKKNRTLRILTVSKIVFQAKNSLSDWGDKMVEGLQMTKQQTGEKKYFLTCDEAILEEKEKAFLAFLQDKEHLFENLILNCVLVEGFPFGHQLGIWENYCLFALIYDCFYVLLMSIVKQNTTEEELIDAIVVLSRAILHSNKQKEHMEKFLHEQEWETLAHMAYMVL